MREHCMNPFVIRDVSNLGRHNSHILIVTTLLVLCTVANSLSPTSSPHPPPVVLCHLIFFPIFPCLSFIVRPLAGQLTLISVVFES